jgi:hypothetical protein
MNDITEEELQKAVAGEETNTLTGLAADLQAEFTEGEEPKTETEPAQEEVSTDEPAKEESAQEEPKSDEQPAEEQEPVAEEEQPAQEEQPEEPKLILGKFKSQEDLEKAYQNLERKMGEKAQEVKEVTQVKSDDFDKAVDIKIAEESWKIVDKAFDTITDPEQAKEAQYLLMQFKKTANPEYLEKARGYLDARVDRRLEVATMDVAAKIRQEANAHRQEILLKPLAEELDKMAEEDPEFMNDEQNQNLMAMAIKLNPTTVDVRMVKKEIQSYGKSQYERGYEAAKKEFAKQVEKKAVSVKSTTHIETPKPKKPVESMSIQDQLEEEMKSLLS